MTQPRKQYLNSGVVITLGIIVVGLTGILALVIGQLFSADDAGDEPLRLALRLEVVAEGLDSPVLLTGDGSGRRYVLEQRGTITALDPDGRPQSELFLDIRDRVVHHHERGLLGLAFHPRYDQNGRFFVLYSRLGDGATAISEFSRTGSGDLEASERPILVIPQPSTLHKAGMLAFDAEGMLIAAIGDGTAGNDPDGLALDRASLLGKLLRLDVDRGLPYAIPTDNGFFEDRQARPEVHAIGLRNPWRFSVDPASGHLYIGDVGQATWEEIDVLAPGVREASFGWSEMEGDACFGDRDCDPTAHIAPAVSYAHADGETGHCSVVGGYAYRGAAGSLPEGAYLLADYCSRTIWGVPASELQRSRATPAVVAQVPERFGRVQSFGQDDAGELYLLTDGGYVLGISAA